MAKRSEVKALALRVSRLIVGAFAIGDEYCYGDFINDFRDGEFADYAVGIGQASQVWGLADRLADERIDGMGEFA